MFIGKNLSNAPLELLKSRLDFGIPTIRAVILWVSMMIIAGIYLIKFDWMDIISEQNSDEIVKDLISLGGGVASISALLFAIIKGINYVGSPDLDLKNYIQSPNYKDRIAFIDKFQDDFKKIVAAYAGKNKRVYVFIDDIDRCEGPKAADIMSAINTDFRTPLNRHNSM